MATTRKNQPAIDDAALRALSSAVKSEVGRRAARGGFEARNRDDLVQEALVKALAALRRHPDANVNAVARVVVGGTVVDMWRTRFRRDGDLAAELPMAAPAHLPVGPGDFVHVKLGEETEAAVLREEDETRRRRFAAYLTESAFTEQEAAALAHTSARFFRREEQERALLILRLLIAAQPTAADRNLVYDAFVIVDMTLAELGRRNGSVSAVAVHNRLGRHVDELGFLGRHFRNMDTVTLGHLCTQVENDDSRVSLDQLVQSAANYASMHEVMSAEHAEVALDISRHMKWIGRNMPGNRRNIDKICRQLVRGAAQYVILRHDARDDMLHERGLWDDRQVARAVRLCVRDVMAPLKG
jgi:DNA-directed RNA polymerase specialized sigma24 family protein